MTRGDITVSLKTLRIAFVTLLVVMVAAIGGLLVFWSSQADAGSSFNLNCAFTRNLNDDPIVYPGAQGASHLHAFFGNKTTNYASTNDSMNAVPASSSGTSCQNTKDRAGYWAPAAYINGQLVNPKNIKAYYIHEINGTIKPFPVGLKMLGASGASTAPQSTGRVYFGCGSGTGISTRDNVNFVCNSGSFAMHVIFPDCGLPGGLEPSDMAYSVGHACDSAHTEHYPQLAMRVNYTTVKDPRTLEFSCIATQPACNTSTMRAPYYTAHGDFWNFWIPEELARLVKTI